MFRHSYGLIEIFFNDNNNNNNTNDSYNNKNNKNNNNKSSNKILLDRANEILKSLSIIPKKIKAGCFFY